MTVAQLEEWYKALALSTVGDSCRLDQDQREAKEAATLEMVAAAAQVCNTCTGRQPCTNETN